MIPGSEAQGSRAGLTARAWRHTIIAAMALCLAVALGVAWIRRQGEVQGLRRQEALRSALGEKYVNECDLFGCHTVLARASRKGTLSAAATQHRLSTYNSHYAQLASHGPMRGDESARLKAAESKLAGMEASLAAENETAMVAYNTTLTLESQMQTVEDQTHLDRVEINKQHQLLAREQVLLRKEERLEHTAVQRQHAEGERLAQVQTVAHNEESQLVDAKRRLRLAMEDQDKAIKEAHGYRDALLEARRKLVNFKKTMNEKERKLMDEVASEKRSRKQMMQEEESTQQSSELSKDEIIERLTEEVQKLTKELKQRETVIHLQQSVIKVQATEVHTLEKTAQKNVNAAADSMSAVMKSAEAAMTGSRIKHEEDEARENAEIEAAHPGIDPATIPNVFAAPEPPAPALPSPEDWRKFGEDAHANNPEVVGQHGVVNDRNFAEGVKGAYPEQSEEERAARERAVKEADAAIESFDKQEEHQKEEFAAFVNQHASPEDQARAESNANEKEFERMMANRPPPDTTVSVDNFLQSAEMEREKALQEIRDRQIERKQKEERLAKNAEEADNLVHGLVHRQVSGLEKQAAAIETSPLSPTSSPPSPAAQGGGLLPQAAHKDLKGQLNSFQGMPQGKAVKTNTALHIQSSALTWSTLSKVDSTMPSKLPPLKPLLSTQAMGGIAGATSWNANGNTKESSHLSLSSKSTPAALQPGAGNAVPSSSALLAKASGVASFIVGHAPSHGHANALKQERERQARLVEDAKTEKISLTPQDAVLPPMAPPASSAVHKGEYTHAGKGPAPAATKSKNTPGNDSEQVSNSGTNLPATVKKSKLGIAGDTREGAMSEQNGKGSGQWRTTSAKIKKDTVQDDVMRASQQLESYDFLNPHNEATLADALTSATPQKAVAEKMLSIERQEKDERHRHFDTWEPTGLRVDRNTQGTASADHSAGLKQTGKGRSKLAQGRSQSLVELPEDMRGGLHVGKSFEREQVNPGTISFRDSNRGAVGHESALQMRVEQAQHKLKAALREEEAAATARESEARKAASAERKAAALAKEAVTKLHQLEAKAAVRTVYETAEKLGNLGGGGGRAVRKQEWEIKESQQPIEHGERAVRSPAHNNDVIFGNRESGSGGDENKRRAVGSLGSVRLPGKRGDGVVESVGGPIQGKLAQDIANDLTKLRDMTTTMKGNIPSVDASMDVKAALQDLTQLSKSESSIMNPPPLKFEVKVPAGGVPGRRMEVHLPDGRKEMVVIPQNIKVGQMLEVDAPRPLHF